MKRLFITPLLALTLLGGCRVAKPIERIEKTDSTTTITARPVKVVIPADSIKSVQELDGFDQAFHKAKHGEVFLIKQGKRVSYSITKKSDTDFEIRAHAAQVDTSVVVTDTHTKVSKSVATVTEKQTSGIQKLWTGVKNYVLVTLLFLLLLLFLLRRNR